MKTFFSAPDAEVVFAEPWSKGFSRNFRSSSQRAYTVLPRKAVEHTIFFGQAQGSAQDPIRL